MYTQFSRYCERRAFDKDFDGSRMVFLPKKPSQANALALGTDQNIMSSSIKEEVPELKIG